MKAELARNINAYFLAFLGVACVVAGHYTGDAELTKIGVAAWTAALVAFHTSIPNPNSPPADPGAPK
jgi:hypothetical protein